MQNQVKPDRIPKSATLAAPKLHSIVRPAETPVGTHFLFSFLKKNG
jgi:hypothetical protein